MDGLSSPTTAADGRWPLVQCSRSYFCCFCFHCISFPQKMNKKPPTTLVASFFYALPLPLPRVHWASIDPTAIDPMRPQLINFYATHLFALFGLFDTVRTVFGRYSDCIRSFRPMTRRVLRRYATFDGLSLIKPEKHNKL